MDLLSLVLAKQPTGKLTSLPRLSRSRVFRFIWFGDHDFGRESLETEMTIEQMASEHGELSETATKFNATEFLLYRAIFLNNSGAYNFFSDARSGEDSFWYAIQSGTPKIQARALANAFMNVDTGVQKYMHVLRLRCAVYSEFGSSVERAPNDTPRDFQRHSFLKGFGDAAVIPWTDNLEELIGELIDQLTPIYRAGDQTDSKTIAASSGYYFPLIDGMRAGTFSPRDVIEVAFDCFAYGLIRYMIYEMKFSETVSYIASRKRPVRLDSVICARKCLADPEILARMDDQVKMRYRVIAGDVIDTPVTAGWRRSVYNPDPINNSTETTDVYSVQGIIAYEPLGTFTWPTMATQLATADFIKSREYLAYMRGQGLKNSTIPFPRQSFPDYPTDAQIDNGIIMGLWKNSILEIRQKRGEFYQKILSALKSEW